MAVHPDLARRIVTAARKGREWRERRDRLIVEAVEAGGSQHEVARLAGVSQPTVRDIWRRGRGQTA